MKRLCGPALHVLPLACALISLGPTAISTPRPGEPRLRLTLPAPSVRTPIGVRSLWWVDPARADPFVPHRRRELVVTLWYPAATGSQKRLAPYMPAAAARIFEQIEGAPFGTFHAVRTHAVASAPVASGRHAVVVFSPAFGFTSALYTALLEDLAARGYVVASIDPTYEAFAVQFPGGRVEKPRVPKRASALNESLSVRIADLRFVLGRLAALDQRGRFAHRLDLGRVGVVGHSIGGATAVNVLLAHPRVRAAVDLDGSMLGPVVGRRLDRPVMLLTSNGAYREDPSLHRLWANLEGARVRLLLVGSGHYTFSDLAVLLPQFGAAIPPGLQYDPIGTIPPKQAISAVRAATTAFLDRHVRGRRVTLLERPSKLFPLLRRF